MTITSAEIKTEYDIEYTFEDFIEALEDPDLRLGRPKAFKGLPSRHDASTDGELLGAFKNLSWIPAGHGDTFSALAAHFGFDGWRNAGYYDDRRDLRVMTVYRRGAHKIG